MPLLNPAYNSKDPRATPLPLLQLLTLEFDIDNSKAKRAIDEISLDRANRPGVGSRERGYLTA
jgi:hypothetical protein